MASGSGRPIFSGFRRRVLFTVLLVALLALAGCAFPLYPGSSRPVHRSTPPTTPSSPLASQTVYWSQNTWLTALRASDGKVRWQTGGNWRASCGDSDCSFSYGPLKSALASDTIYALGNNEHNSAAVYAFAAHDGTIRWQVPVAGCLALPVASPLVAAGVVYVSLTEHWSGGVGCGPTGWVYALRSSDGHTLWRVPFAQLVWPTLALTNGVLVVANSTYPANPEVVTLTGLRASDGKQVWRLSRNEQIGYDLIQFTAKDGTVITSQSAPSGMVIEAFRANDGVRLWGAKISSRLGGAPPFLIDGVVYVNSDLGYLYALHATNGTVIWRFQTNGVSIGAPVFANGYLYMGWGRDLAVLDAASGAMIRSYRVFEQPPVSSDPNYSWSAPVIMDSTIFVSAGVFDCPGGCRAMDQLDGKLYALDITTGKLLWQYQSPRGFAVNAPMLGD